MTQQRDCARVVMAGDDNIFYFSITNGIAFAAAAVPNSATSRGLRSRRIGAPDLRAQQMLAVIVALTLILAVLAHIKLYFIQQGSLSMFQVIGRRFRDIEAAAVALEPAAPVVPDGPAAAVKPASAAAGSSAADAAEAGPSGPALIAFYGLTAQQRATLFQAVASQLSGEAFHQLWVACYSEDALKRAFAIQQVVRHGATDAIIAAINIAAPEPVAAVMARPVAQPAAAVEAAPVAAVAEPEAATVAAVANAAVVDAPPAAPSEPVARKKSRTKKTVVDHTVEL